MEIDAVWKSDSLESRINKRFLQDYDNHKVYVISGHALRGVDEKFGDFLDVATHIDFDMIPSNEIWVSDELDEPETKIAIVSANKAIADIEKGKTKDVAKSDESETEESLRAKVFNHELTNKLYKKKFFTINDESGAIEVWIVDGEMVRNTLALDKHDPFVEGGNHYAHDYVPPMQIWLDDTVDESEFDAIMIHEYVELCLMRDGISYDKAHEIATHVEYGVR